MGGAPLDLPILRRVEQYAAANERFSRTQMRPSSNRDALVLDYDLGYFPVRVTRAYLTYRWYQNDDFKIHYAEQYATAAWECRWDRHPNPHNTRGHFHEPPDARRTTDETYSTDWREVFRRVTTFLDERIDDGCRPRP